ncbi:replication initiation protein [Enterobacterales bacterium CwR94]|nr:replication initiation protein [Enterobacterales bacterium CwR94]
MAKKPSKLLQSESPPDYIDLDALERASRDETYWQWIHQTDSVRPVKPTRRRRGEHSTACKCPNPFFSRPEDYKPLAGELGYAYRRLIKRDRKTRQASLRMRVSRHPYFVQLREAAGRSRDFRPDRQHLIDALVPLLISCADISTHIVAMNLSKLAAALSPKDENNEVIPETAVTVTRICRLIGELITFGLLELPTGVQWDRINRHWFPKHVVLSEQLWKIIGVNIDKIYAQQSERLHAEADGFLSAGEEISVRAARKRWYERMRQATLVRRREEAVKQKRVKKYGKLPFDDRLNAMAKWLVKNLPADEVCQMSTDEFERMAHLRLYQLNLGLDDPPPDNIH